MRILIGGLKGQTRNYEQALKVLGAHPSTLLPELSFDDSGSDDLSEDFHGLLLPGGGDIHPGFFGQPNLGSSNINPQLDSQQFALFHTFFKAGKPILGICKGMQIINVALGGTILQDLPKQARSIHAYAEADQIHDTQILPGTFLHRLYGDSLVTNSAHHQAIDRLGQGLMAAQYGPEGVIEGFFHTSRPILGVQWHPERLHLSPAASGAELPNAKNPETSNGFRILTYFLSLCQSKSN
ncbi:MAG: gamma-glutamyl-gamma-aminobutyrate hydrolase family protein [Lachnospiraceae bacterium]|nr:gamma-glutamyl-gamma-aminobutyrate hydrolase family protein [Lachnospiraceae bacterium]